MLSYLLRRMMLMIPTLLGITMLVFSVVALAPGKPGAMLLSTTGDMRPDERAAVLAYFSQRYGLDKPFYIQYLRWLNKISPVGLRTWTAEDPQVIEAQRAAEAQPPAADGSRPRPTIAPGDFRWRLHVKAPELGDSFVYQRRVADMIREALPVTLVLQLCSLPISYALAVTLGIIAARKRGQLADYGIGTALLALWSLPTMWVGVMLVGYLASQQFYELFPAAGLHSLGAAAMPFLPRASEGAFRPGWLLDMLYHMVLPLICLSYANFAFLSKLTRTALLETLGADFVRTARAKGLAERVVLLRHALRNSLIPLITVLATLLPAMITGSVIVESIFSISGMGRLAVEGLRLKDQELFLSITLVTSVLTLLSYLVADILYVIADPRVSYE